MTSNLSQKTSNLTVIIPTKNSEQFLPRCLESVKSCREVIVVDSNSKDETESIVKSYGRVYVNFKWNKKYPKKRAWALDKLSIDSDWILMLDSDECINDEFLREFDNKIIKSKHNAFWIYYNNYFMNKLMRYGISQKKLALIRKNHGTYEDFGENDWTEYDMEIHEHVLVDGTVGKVNTKLSHLQNESYEQMLDKHYEYAKWEARRYVSFSSKSSSTLREKIKYLMIDKFLFSYFYFFFQYFIFLGFLDGFEGYKYAKIKFKYFKKVYELLRK